MRPPWLQQRLLDELCHVRLAGDGGVEVVGDHESLGDWGGTPTGVDVADGGVEGLGEGVDGLDVVGEEELVGEAAGAIVGGG